MPSLKAVWQLGYDAGTSSVEQYEREHGDVPGVPWVYKHLLEVCGSVDAISNKVDCELESTEHVEVALAGYTKGVTWCISVKNMLKRKGTR